MLSSRFHSLILGVILAALWVNLGPVTAAQPVQAAELGDVVLRMTPVKQEIELQPSSSRTETFQLINRGEAELHFSLSVRPFQVEDFTYDTNFSTINQYTQIIDWITFSQKIGTLQPGESVDITYTVNTPADIPGGGQYAVIVAETADAANEDSNIQFVGSVGMLLYAQVSGDTRVSGELISADIPSLAFNKPVSALSTIHNSGNVDFTVTTELIVNDFFTGHEVYSNRDSLDEHILLPDTTRSSTVKWKQSPKLGIFKVQQNLKFLDQDITTEQLVIVCPIWLICAIGFITALLIALVVIAVCSAIRRRRYRGSMLTN